MKKNKKIYLCLTPLIVGGAVVSTASININKQIRNKSAYNLNVPIAYAGSGSASTGSGSASTGSGSTSTGSGSTSKYTLQQFIKEVNKIPENLYITKVEAKKIKESTYFNEYNLKTWESNKQDQIQNRLFELFEDETDGFTKLEKIKIGQLILINHGYLQYFQNLGFDKSMLNNESQVTNNTVIDPLSDVELISNHHNFKIIKTTGYETSNDFRLGDYDKIVNIDHQNMINTLFSLMKQAPTFKSDFVKLKDKYINDIKSGTFSFPSFIKDIQKLMMKFLGENDLNKNIWNIHPLLKLLSFSGKKIEDNFKEFLRSELGGYLYGKNIKTKLMSFHEKGNQKRLLINSVNDVIELFLYGVKNTKSSLVDNLLSKGGTKVLAQNKVDKLLFLIKKSIVESENFTKLVHWRIAGDFFNGYKIYVSTDFSEWENITLEKDSIVSVPVFQETNTNYSKAEIHTAISKQGNYIQKQIKNFTANEKKPGNSETAYSKNSKQSDKSVMELDANSEVYLSFDIFNKESKKYNTQFSNKNTRKLFAKTTEGAVNKNYFISKTKFNWSEKGILVPNETINKTNLNLGINFLVGEKGTSQAIHLKKWEYEEKDLIERVAAAIKKARDEETKIKEDYSKNHNVKANQLISNIYITSIQWGAWLNTVDKYKDGDKKIKWTSAELNKNSFVINFNIEIEQV